MGKLKRHKYWITWSRAIKKYNSIIFVQDIIPLSYGIRESGVTEYTIESQPNYGNCVTLTGLTCKKYARKVHHIIHGFVQVETADTWINFKERKQDNQLDYLALLDHYGGEGNKEVRIKEAESLRTSLIYNNERVMSFEKFITNMQKNFTGLSDNG